MFICCKHANARGLISCEVCLSSTSKDQNTKTYRKSKVSAFIVIVKRHLLACHSGGIDVVHWWNNYGVCPPIAVIITIVVMRMDCCTFSPPFLFLAKVPHLHQQLLLLCFDAPWIFVFWFQVCSCVYSIPDVIEFEDRRTSSSNPWWLYQNPSVT